MEIGGGERGITWVLFFGSVWVLFVVGSEII
ncbi:uncharacterized protein G2W53_016060 [Senna tora]|uniref:Uncharacterized protein n=1 Tax=Senna tora TaxID=362788 RepID=A0A834WWX7_9FABA|nr:uncharacterized protein G2W53_016060 [Senna tora]